MKSKRRMGGECGKYGGEEVGFQDLMEKSEGKRPLVRLRCRWDHKHNLGGGGGETPLQYSST